MPAALPGILARSTIVLFGDSLTQRGFEPEGWAAALANYYGRRAARDGRLQAGTERQQCCCGAACRHVLSCHIEVTQRLRRVSPAMGSVMLFSTVIMMQA